jgi:hypothetical protein
VEKQIKNKAQVFGTPGEYARCNLCNNMRHMSQAHVPPKTCIEKDRRGREAQHYFFGLQKYNMQNGVHFYTICKKCNEDLGTPHDKELGKFSASVRSKIDSFRHIPFFPWRFECNPHQIARSLIGSYLTASKDCVDDSYARLQEYILKVDGGLPERLRVGFWLHCYDSITVIPDFFVQELNRAPQRILLMVKYYPLAWILYIESDGYEDFCQRHDLHDFTQYIRKAASRVNIEIYPTKEKHEFWPWCGDGMSIVIGKNASDNAILGVF